MIKKLLKIYLIILFNNQCYTQTKNALPSHNSLNKFISQVQEIKKELIVISLIILYGYELFLIIDMNIKIKNAINKSYINDNARALINLLGFDEYNENKKDWEFNKNFIENNNHFISKFQLISKCNNNTILYNIKSKNLIYTIYFHLDNKDENTDLHKSQIIKIIDNNKKNIKNYLDSYLNQFPKIPPMKYLILDEQSKDNESEQKLIDIIQNNK